MNSRVTKIHEYYTLIQLFDDATISYNDARAILEICTDMTRIKILIHHSWNNYAKDDTNDEMILAN